jgi:hypothetical protein
MADQVITLIGCEKKAKGIIYDKILEHLSILRKKRSEEIGL